MKNEPESNRACPLNLLIIALAALSCAALVAMAKYPEYLYTSLVIGCVAVLLDIPLEYLGVFRKKWTYRQEKGGVPFGIPLFFFFAGILATQAFYILNSPEAQKAFSQDVGPFDTYQWALVVMGVIFTLLYLARLQESLSLALLPFGLALFMEFNKPWMLVCAMGAVYLDFIIEKKLTRKGAITYGDRKGHLPVEVPLTYFSTTLILLGIAGIIVRDLFHFRWGFY